MRPDKYGIITVRGPRRVGKTTLIKLLIRELLKKGVEEDRIFYIPLDLKELRNINLMELLREIAYLPGEKYVFMDEASMLRDWALILKNAADSGLVDRGMKILVTGSHSMDLAEAVSKLSGRQGELAKEFNLGGNLVHLPMRFIEVLEAIRPDLDEYLSSTGLRKVRTRFSALEELSNGKIPESIEEFYSLFGQFLNDVFLDYMLHGGFPKAVDQYHRRGRVDPNFYDDLAKLIIADSESAGLNPENTKRVLEFLVKRDVISSRLDPEKKFVGVQEGLPKKLNIGKYIEYLETANIFFFPYRERKNEKCKPNYEYNRKVYPIDPFSYHAIRAHLLGVADPLEDSRQLLKDEGFKGQLVEGIVGAHLRMAQQLFAHVPYVDHHRVLMYGESDGEVDFILCLRKDGRRVRITVESKYRSRIRPSEAKIVVTKDRLEAGESVYVPAPLFLVLF